MSCKSISAQGPQPQKRKPNQAGAVGEDSFAKFPGGSRRQSPAAAQSHACHRPVERSAILRGGRAAGRGSCGICRNRHLSRPGVSSHPRRIQRPAAPSLATARRCEEGATRGHQNERHRETSCSRRVPHLRSLRKAWSGGGGRVHGAAGLAAAAASTLDSDSTQERSPAGWGEAGNARESPDKQTMKNESLGLAEQPARNPDTGQHCFHKDPVRRQKPQKGARNHCRAVKCVVPQRKYHGDESEAVAQRRGRAAAAPGRRELREQGAGPGGHGWAPAVPEGSGGARDGPGPRQRASHRRPSLRQPCATSCRSRRMTWCLGSRHREVRLGLTPPHDSPARRTPGPSGPHGTGLQPGSSHPAERGAAWGTQTLGVGRLSPRAAAGALRGAASGGLVERGRPTATPPLPRHGPARPAVLTGHLRLAPGGRTRGPETLPRAEPSQARAEGHLALSPRHRGQSLREFTFLILR